MADHGQLLPYMQDTHWSGLRFFHSAVLRPPSDSTAHKADASATLGELTVAPQGSFSIVAYARTVFHQSASRIFTIDAYAALIWRLPAVHDHLHTIAFATAGIQRNAKLMSIRAYVVWE